MNKIIGVAWIMGFVVIAYVLLLVFNQVILSATSSANTTMSATSNMSNYPGTLEAVNASPWILWFVPAVGGTIVLIFHLRRP